MKLPISMWSGAISWVAPPSCSAPLTVSRFEPIPWMSAPIFTSRRARSCTWGSQAALWITVAPGRQRGRHQHVLGRHHRRLVHQHVAGAQAVLGVQDEARRRSRRPRRAPRSASMWGSSRRRPMKSPPGGGISARPRRASSGPASRNEARICSPSAASTARRVDARRRTASARSRRASRRGRRGPRGSRASRRRRGSAGRCRDTARRRSAPTAAIIASAPFLLPAGTTVPVSGAPPWMTSLSIASASGQA